MLRATRKSGYYNDTTRARNNHHRNIATSWAAITSGMIGFFAYASSDE